MSSLCLILKPSMNSNWSYSPEMLNSGQNQQFFLSRVTSKFDRCPWKTIGYLFYSTSSFVHHFKAISLNSSWSYSPEMLNLGKNWWFFVLGDLEIWRMPIGHLCIISKPSLNSNWNYTFTVWKHSIRIKISDFLSHVTLKFDRWPWKI